MSKTKPKTLGQLIREVREAANLSQVALAGLLGTEQSYVSRVELDKTMPMVPMLRRIGEALGGEFTLGDPVAFTSTGR